MSKNSELHFTASPVTVVGAAKKANRMYALLYVVVSLDGGCFPLVIKAWSASFPDIFTLREGNVIGLSGTLTYYSSAIVNSGLAEPGWVVSLNCFVVIPQLSVMAPEDGFF
jgi:hypothetical protein